jgi:RNA polymerase sigma factor (sigma-70 family)
MKNRNDNNTQAANNNALSFEPYVDRHPDWNVVRGELAESTDPLSPEEEREAFTAMVRAAIDGDDDRRVALRDRIFKANMRLAPGIAYKFLTLRRHVYGEYASDLVDLVHVAYAAIYDAIDKFDVNRGTRFSTYACTAIYRALNKADGIRKRYEKGVGPMMRFDEVVSQDDEEMTRLDMFEDEGAIPIHEMACCRIKAAKFSAKMRSLPRRERDLVSVSLGLAGGDVRLKDVARMYGISAARASQIVKLCAEKLRQHLAA